MTTTHIQPQPPPRQGMGCLGKGCLILCCFILFLLVLGSIGVWWGYKHHSGVMKGAVWASQIHLLANKPAPVPDFPTTPENVAAAKQKWDAFEQAGDRKQPATIELTAADINNLIAGSRHANGKVFVSIEGNRLHVQTSVPLGEYVGRVGYFLNGDIVVESSSVRSLDQPSLAGVTVNGQPLPQDVLDWQVKSRSVGSYLSEYRGEYEINSAEIRDGKVILQRGPRS